MLNGYDITNMSNDEVNLIMKGLNPAPFDPDKRIDVVDKAEENRSKLRIKIFSAINTDHLTKIVNEFLENNSNMEVHAITPYTFNDKGTCKHCVLIRYME